MEIASQPAAAPSPRRPVLLIVVSALGWLAAIAVGAFLWQSLQTGKHQAAELLSNQQTIAALDTQTTTLRAERDSQQAARDDLQTRLDASLAMVAGLESQVLSARASYTAARTDITRLQSELDASRADARQARQAVLCSNRPAAGFSYISNASMSEQLKEWVGDTSESVNQAKWEVVWNNTKTAIHRLTGKYTFVFIVDFDDAKLGRENSVYSVGNSCFLDKP